MSMAKVEGGGRLASTFFLFMAALNKAGVSK